MQWPHWIDGSAHEPTGRGWLEVFDPATGKPFAEVARGNAADVDVAIAAAQRAFPAWSALPTSERAAWLEKLASALEDRKGVVSGKSVSVRVDLGGGRD